MATNISLDLTDQPAEADVKAVEHGLNAYNEPFSGPYLPRPLAIFLRGDEGRVLGGLVADTSDDWLKIDMLWVDDTLRGHGWGSRLLLAAAGEGLALGCRRAALDTASFQAPDFYRRHGYQVIGTVPNFNEGHDLFYMIKDLVPSPTAPEDETREGVAGTTEV